MTLELTPISFPLKYRNKQITVSRIDLFLKVNDLEAYAEGEPLVLTLLAPGASESVRLTLEADETYEGKPHVSHELVGIIGTWTLQAAEADIAKLPEDFRTTSEVNGIVRTRLRADRFDDAVLVFHYTAE